MLDSKTLGLVVLSGIGIAFLWPLGILAVIISCVCLPCLLFYLAMPVRAKKNPQRSVPVGPKRKDGGRPRRHVDFAESLVFSMVDGVETFPEVFRRSVQEFADRPCLGTRKTIRTMKKERTIDRGGEDVKKTITIPLKTNYQWQTYKEIGDAVTAFGSSLNHIGLRQGDNLAIFLDTCPEWQVCCQSSMERGIVVVTVYASLGHDALVYALSVAKVSAVFTSGKLVKKLLDAKIPSIKSIMYTGKCDEEKEEESPELYSYEDMIEKGKDEVPVEVNIKRKDLAAIMFTSGSTGNPKGVLISHENMLAGCAGIYHGTGDALDDSDIYLAYLPLAHILEFCAEAAILTIGARVGYGSAHTLQGDSCYDADERPAGDITTLKPTAMPAVPLILDKMRKGATKAAMSRGFVVGTMFKIMYFLKHRQYLQGNPAPLCDKIVFNKFVTRLGGDLKILVSGGAPLSADTQKFMNICFNAPIAQGYGATETTGNGTVTNISDVTTGRVGPPVPSCEIRLVDCPDMGYTSSDAPYPRGEICIRGPVVTAGYFNMTKDQAKSFEEDPDGDGTWFHTGDIGMWHADGTLQIIDRKKDLVKLAVGEYIALGNLEAIYKESKYVENVCVYADSFKNSPVALVILNEPATLELGVKLDIKGSLDDLSKREEVRQAVMSDMLQVASRAKLKRFEKVSNIMMLPEPWTPQNGLLTEAMKLKRNVINKQYKTEYNGLYD